MDLPIQPVIALLPTVDLAVIATTGEPVQAESLWLTVLAAVFLSVVHGMSSHIHRTLLSSERITNSLFGGMAVAYVFLYLLPELEPSHEVIGEAIHFFILIGFLMFYGAEHYSRTRYRERYADQGEHRSATLTFYVRLAFIWFYNALFIYTMPERIQESIPFFLLNTIAISLHIVQVDYHLARRYGTMFHAVGRYALIAAPLIGAGIDWYDGTPDELVGDMLTALLAGFVLVNVFSEELPEHDKSDFRWFLTGVVVYALLIHARHYLD